MKSPEDPRHKKRQKIIQQLFAESFTTQKELLPETRSVLKLLKKIDKKISKYAPQWPPERLNKIDLAILRLAIYEFEKKTAPPKVIIDEAVELAKEFGSESSPAFVNGVLGAIYESEKKSK